MKIALTVWEEKISPVFDSSSTLMIVEIDSNQILNRHLEFFDPGHPLLLAEQLKKMGISLLICGAISEFPCKILEMGQLVIVPFIAGEIEEILSVMEEGLSIVPKFLMPGCRRNTCKKYQKKLNNKKEVYNE